MGTKVEVRTIPLHGLFIHRKQVWRSLGKLRAESHVTLAQKVFINEYNTEVYTENADFIDGLIMMGSYQKYQNTLIVARATISIVLGKIRFNYGNS